MDQDTKAPSGTPIRWIDAGSDSVRWRSFSLGDPVPAQPPQARLEFELPVPEGAFSAESLIHARLKLDDGREVGFVTLDQIDVVAGTMRLVALLAPGIGAADIEGHTLVVPIYEIRTIEKEPIRVRVGRITQAT